MRPQVNTHPGNTGVSGDGVTCFPGPVTWLSCVRRGEAVPGWTGSPNLAGPKPVAKQDPFA